MEVVRFLLEKDVSINTKDQRSYTPLRCAVIHRASEDLIREVRKSGGTIEMSDDDIYQEITWAIHKNDVELLVLFIAAGIDVNVSICTFLAKIGCRVMA